MFRKKIKFFSKSKSLASLNLPFIIILTFLLIIFNKTDYFLANKIKSHGIDIITPVATFISFPVKASVNVINSINEIKFLKNENLKLKEELTRLKKWQTLAIKSSRENKAYKKLLNSTSYNANLIKTATVISRSPNIYSKTAIINAGIIDKISEDMIVINARGLVGKVVNVSNKNSKVLLINDIHSSVPVKILNKDYYAIISGSQNGKFLYSSFVKNENKAQIGDILVTSGNTSLYPKDILVGKIIDISDKKIIALPYVNFQNLEIIQIINNQ